MGASELPLIHLTTGINRSDYIVVSRSTEAITALADDGQLLRIYHQHPLRMEGNESRITALTDSVEHSENSPRTRQSSNFKENELI